MSGRLDLVDIATRIATEFSVSVADEAAPVYVSTCYDPKYWSLFFSKWPAVWVCAQRLIPRDSGVGFSQIARQNCDVQILIRPTVQRVPEVAGVSVESRLSELYQSIDDALFGWTPPGASMPFTWASSVDGAPYKPICTVDMIYSTLVTKSKQFTA